MCALEPSSKFTTTEKQKVASDGDGCGAKQEGRRPASSSLSTIMQRAAARRERTTQRPRSCWLRSYPQDPQLPTHAFSRTPTNGWHRFVWRPQQSTWWHQVHQVVNASLSRHPRSLFQVMDTQTLFFPLLLHRGISTWQEHKERVIAQKPLRGA